MVRIYNRVVIDIESGRIVKAELSDYAGPIAKLKGGGGGTTTTTTGLPAWLQPYAEKFINAEQAQTFDENGNVIAQPGDLNQQTAPFNPLQEAAMGGIVGRTGGLQGYADLGLNQSANTLAGNYLSPDTNPWLDQTFNRAVRNVTDQYSTATAPSILAAAQKSGNFGGSAMDEAMALSRYGLGENLNNLATGIYGGNYANERANQLNTLNMMPATLQANYAPLQTALGVGAAQQEQTQAGMDTSYSNAVNRTQFPFEILSGFGGALGQAGMGAGTSTSRAGSSGGLMGTVICTELHRQGLMDDATLAADLKFGDKLPAEVICGYHLWAIPVAQRMKSSRLLTRLLAPIALAWAREMRARVERRGRGSMVGKALLWFGVPICGWLGKAAIRREARI